MHVFFSDTHLGLGSREDSKRREQCVVAFLDHVAAMSPDTLWIVGDLFDYWFDYRTVVPRAFVRTLGALARLTDSGVNVEYIIGNHDFGHRDFFESELGVTMHSADVERTIHGRRVFISHGDGKALNDTGYRILKKILRSRISNALWRFLHPDIGIGIAASASRKSRVHTSQKYYGGNRPGEKDGLQLFAQNRIEREGYDLVVMGHNHAVMREQYEAGEYINLGDWLGKERHFLVVTDKDVELRRFDCRTATEQVVR